jgi:hypothetical protein
MQAQTQNPAYELSPRAKALLGGFGSFVLFVGLTWASFGAATPSTAGLLTAAATTATGVISYTPAITEFTPTTGEIGSYVTISGVNFKISKDMSSNIVMFGQKQAEVISIAGSEEAGSVSVVVPAGISGNVPITLTTTRGTTSATGFFTVTEPVLTLPSITEINPAAATAGETIYITGENFAKTARQNAVSFISASGGTVRALSVTPVLLGGASALKVVVPPAAATGRITVTVDGVSTESEQIFELATDTTVPEITNISNSNPSVGDTVLLTGTNLLNRAGGKPSLDQVAVDFNGGNAKIKNFSAKADSTDVLMLEIPADATDGFITVSVAGKTAISSATVTIRNSTASTGAPVINLARSNAALSGAGSSLTVNAFISDLDGAANIAIVNLDLSALGGSPSNAMLPGAIEGSGQFYSLANFTLPSPVSADLSPFVLQVTATDQSGKTGKGELLACLDSCPLGLAVADITKANTELIGVTATAANKLQITFDNKLLPSSLDVDGKNFTITTAGGALEVLAASLSADGQGVTITTAAQESNIAYTLQISNLTGENGKSVFTTAGQLQFSGWNQLASAAPKNIRLQAEEAGIRLSWQMSSDPAVTGYRVKYSTTSGQYLHQLDVGRATAYLVANLQLGTRYYFVVQSYDATGQLSPNPEEIALTFIPGSSAGSALHAAAPALSDAITAPGQTAVYDFSQPTYLAQNQINGFVPEFNYHTASMTTVLPARLSEQGPAETLALAFGVAILLSGIYFWRRQLC